MLIIISLNVQGQRKLSPLVRQTMLSAQNASMAKGAHTSERFMNAFVRTADADVLRQHGCRILASFDDIHIATIPISQLRTLAANDVIERIEAGPRHTTLLDSAAIYVNMPAIWDASLSPDSERGYLGKGVVLGIMDIGFDLTHPGFYSRDMNEYRIKAMWDQLDRTGGGAAVTGVDTTYLGRQYVGREQLLALGHSYDGYAQSHGTSTLYCATGNGVIESETGVGRGYLGMAPDADICIVANAAGNNADSIPKDMLDMYNTTLDMLGFKYLFDYAEAHNQPCVVTFSEGSYPSMYSDDLLYAEVLQRLTGPGKILCAAAGNEAYHKTHVSKPMGKAEAGAFVEAKKIDVGYTMKSSDIATVRITFYPANADPIVREYNTQQCYAPNSDDPNYCDTLVIADTQYIISLASYRSSFNKDEWAMEIYIHNNNEGYVGREVPVSLTLLGDTVHSELFSLGAYFASNAINPSLADYDSTHNIHYPGGLPGVICVGSTNSRQHFTTQTGKEDFVDWGDIGLHSGFSSVGPSMCGLTKPDVSAPGCMVASAYSSFFHEYNTKAWDISEFQWNGRTYVWHIDCGTSLSCPIVAGIIATWLQACPTLSPEQAMETIAATATKPADFFSYVTTTDERGFTKNNYYGYGVIDAKAGLDYILNTFTGIQSINTSTSDNDCTYDLMGRRITTMQPGNIYIRNGKKFIIR